MSDVDPKNNPEDSVDAAEEQPAPAEEVCAEGVENVPKENGTSEGNTDSIDGEDGDDDDGPAEPDDAKDKPVLKRSSDALDVASEGTDEISSPEKKAKLDDSSADTSSGDAD